MALSLNQQTLVPLYTDETKQRKAETLCAAFKQTMQAVSASQLNHNYEQRRQLSRHLKAGTPEKQNSDESIRRQRIFLADTGKSMHTQNN